MGEGPLEDERQLVGESRFEIGQAGLSHADQRRIYRLMRAAFRTQGQARRRGHKKESRILVTAVVERIETARDERVVDCSYRDEARAEQWRGQSQGG